MKVSRIWQGAVRGALGPVVLAGLAAVALLFGPMVPEAARAEGPGVAGGADIADLARALKVPDLIRVMAAEGAAYGDSLEEELFAGRGGAKWDAEVARIYDPVQMERVFGAGLQQALGSADPGPMIAFFDTPVGRQIVSLEISARESLLDDGTEAASHVQLKELRDTGSPFLNHLRAFIDANDLVESNVAGAMNANYAFYTGMIDSGAFPDTMTDSEVLTDVWSQEPEIRTETEDWVYRYLTLAYRPLPEGVLDNYTAFSRTKAGQQLNAALFAAFDTLFVGISRDLGRAAARYIIGQDL